ncbi:unnamed protein product [Kuraishia capsulata CBS 1993]|uniref:RRM domain-containing protein n=1 Tax=Kuraishia capsulata CBS 1993 TaxID=1382522 RepID=W6ML77_9ASCO|nr:uncharacterized protein KUCA_T00001492001 [Kuraishia capsulata CBS 1993]CDK25522.1 unnamed protein product [Kuraishia capsulata CBS 1993]
MVPEKRKQDVEKVDVALNDSPVAKKPKIEADSVPAQDPNWTLYVKNLNDKLHLKMMKEQLYVMFSTFGDVVAIEYRPKQNMRGQAFVSFGSIEDASLALKGLQGDLFFGKPLSIEFARQTSKAIEVFSTETQNGS